MLLLQLLLVSILGFSESRQAARVLLDQENNLTEIRGRFGVECLSKNRSELLIVKKCQTVHHQNEQNNYTFAAAVFRLDVQRQKVRLMMANNRSYTDIYGAGVRFSGRFSWQGHEFHQLDLLFGRNHGEFIAYIPLETYLQGVLGAEVPASWPLEALKAQAIASRSYFLWKREQHQRYFDVRSDHMDQVFKLPTAVHPQLVQAINETQGKVLTRPSSKQIFPSYFHADCGGHTSTEQAVWRQPASYNRPVQDSVCGSATRNNWQVEFSEPQLLALLHRHFILPRNARLTGIFPRVSGESRAHHVDFLLSDNQIKSLSADNLRQQLGYGQVKSTQFKVAKTLYGFNFSGRGYGHGVGLCQWGAKRWASLGKTHQEILSHYYPTAEINNSPVATQQIAEIVNSH